ncbi:hypothetical protein [Escherichia coli]|uniref:hypothetical protein n=1 Tax=Escherichia coli TaxID=562 RepID=UPI002867B9FD|nr:hypothetical protein [Escherichia coli]
MRDLILQLSKSSIYSTKPLFPCRHHEGVYVDEGIDIESAYKYSMKVYKSNEDKSPFCNVREMTDTVQNYYHEYGGNDTCPLCTKHIDD